MPSYRKAQGYQEQSLKKAEATWDDLPDVISQVLDYDASVVYIRMSPQTRSWFRSRVFREADKVWPAGTWGRKFEGTPYIAEWITPLFMAYIEIDTSLPFLTIKVSKEPWSTSS